MSIKESFKTRTGNEAMSKGVLGNGGFTVAWLKLKAFQCVEGNCTNPRIHNFSLLLAQHRELQSSHAKLSLPIIPIGIVAYAFTLFSGTFVETAVYQSVNVTR